MIKKKVKLNLVQNLWIKCSQCAEVIYNREFEENLKVCPKCGTHNKLSAWERLKIIVDEDSFQEFDDHLSPIDIDPLSFGEEYISKIEEDRRRTNLQEAIITGRCTIGKHKVVIGVMDFSFRGGSMGLVVGEKVSRAAEHAIEASYPLILVVASGGARMQEGILSLMQMAKTSATISRLKRAGLPYISIMTNPTTAGVAASFAALGDIIIVEPKALIGFTGPRVIEQTIKQKLPPGFQLSEFFLEHGMVDMVVKRKELKTTLIKILNYCCHRFMS